MSKCITKARNYEEDSEGSFDSLMCLYVKGQVVLASRVKEWNLRSFR